MVAFSPTLKWLIPNCNKGAIWMCFSNSSKRRFFSLFILQILRIRPRFFTHFWGLLFFRNLTAFLKIFMDQLGIQESMILHDFYVSLGIQNWNNFLFLSSLKLLGDFQCFFKDFLLLQSFLEFHLLTFSPNLLTELF